MEKTIIKSTSFIAGVMLLSCLCLITCSPKIKQNPTGDGTGDNQDFPTDQLIIWRKPDSTDQQVKSWMIRRIEANGSVDITRSCGGCDNALMLLSGPGVKTFIQTNAIDGKIVPGKSSPTTGEEGPVYFSLNFHVKHHKPDTPRINSINKTPPVINRGQAIKIAVFDTGIEPGELTDFAFTSSGKPCIKGAETGWNFVSNNNDPRDDDPIKHGTVVTRFITDEVAKTGRNIRVEILPVKTHDENGVGDLFSILCAFAYAKERGVQIINASFGFYAPRRKWLPEDDPADPNVLLLRKYIQHYLTNNNILLVTAAGNSDSANLRLAFKEHGWPYVPEDPRNLNQVSFFPASLARSDEFPNVIAVTTVNVQNNGEGTVSTEQNFSKDVVDIGVQADKVIDHHYVFNNPILNNRETVEGSSFATPKVTGMLAANYDKIRKIIERKLSKSEIWKELGTGLITTNNSLADEIRDGRILIK